jgi:hypothetical protein
METTDWQAGSAEAAWLLSESRRTLHASLPKLMQKLVEEAEKGSVTHLKLLLQLMGLEDGGLQVQELRPKEKTLEEILRERWQDD